MQRYYFVIFGFEIIRYEFFETRVFFNIKVTKDVIWLKPIL